MSRFILFFLVAGLLFVSAPPSFAGEQESVETPKLEVPALTPTPHEGAKETSDPNDDGWRQKRKGGALGTVAWIDVRSDCQACKSLAQQYNIVMREVLAYRYKIKFLQILAKEAEDEALLHAKQNKNYKPKDDGDLRDIALAMGDLADEERKADEKIAKVQAQLQTAENQAQQLRSALVDCEKQCSGEGIKSGIKAGGVIGGAQDIGPWKQPDLDFNWQGPYADGCFKCSKLAQRLNELEVMARERITLRDSIKRQEKAPILDVTFSETVTNINAELKIIKKNFEQTLKLYNACLKTCEAKAPVKTGSCDKPIMNTVGPHSITIGPNDKFGTGAQFEKDVKNKAKGMAMGALGGLMGGSGMSLGGGGDDDSGGSTQQGPKTEKDPTSGKFTDVSVNGTDLKIRGEYTNEGLVISTEIDDTPEDGTFHAQWLQDANGKIYLPVRYFVISLYRDWSLNVWWTHDKWVNGEHVYHDEGDSLTVGRDYASAYKFFEGAKGVDHALWRLMGFETAVKGVDHIGTVYNIPPEVLESGCGVRLINQISLPDHDPVITEPVTVDLFKNVGKRAIEIGKAI